MDRLAAVDLYVCWTTHDPPLPPHRHSCAAAYDALREAGHSPNVKHTLSYGGLPGALQTPGRRKVKAHTGRFWVPALETDEGEWIGGSKKIIAWAEQHPAAAAPRS
jgi:hypothetical protein